MYSRKEITAAKLLALVLHALFFLNSPIALAKPELLDFLFISKKNKLLEAAPKANLSDYHTYWKARSLIESKKYAALSEIESVEQSILLSKLTAQSRNLEKELDELFWALELKRGEVNAKNKKYENALSTLQRGVQGLPPFKLVYFWRRSTSDALVKICTRNKKKKDDACLALAKKMTEVFPKAALETKALKDLPAFDTLPSAELSNDRLSQTYPADKVDKTDKDEQAFEPLLNAYLVSHLSELAQLAKDFTEAYPKSAFRFRAQFLLAELFFKNKQKEEAEKIYRSIVDAVPLGYYALVASERLGVLAKDKIKKQPISVDSEQFNFNAQEWISIKRASALLKQKKYDEVGIEIDSVNRTRSYSQDAILFLAGMASKAGQSLSAFRLLTELFQRQYDGLLSSEFIEMVFPYQYEKEITIEAKKAQIDPILVMSLMKQESGFRATALSSSGALGLMQIMPFTVLEVRNNAELYTLKNPSVIFRSARSILRHY